MENKGKGNITIFLDLIDFEEKEVHLYGYLFNRYGKLVSKKRVAVKGNKGKVEFPVKKSGRYTVKIAPDVEDVSEIDRYKPVSKVIFFRKEPVHLHFDIPKIVWVCWIKFPYLIKGKVSKDGLPVCIGEVDIYEVDYTACFLRIPDEILEKLKRAVIDEIIKPKYRRQCKTY